MRSLRLAPLALALALALLAVRKGYAVRAVRAADRWGGLTSLRGERAYAASTPLFGALHRRAASDVRSAIEAGARTVVDVGAGPGDLLASLASLAGVEGMRR